MLGEGGPQWVWGIEGEADGEGDGEGPSQLLRARLILTHVSWGGGN